MPEDSSAPQTAAQEETCNADVRQRNSRKEGLDVWQFRWSETSLDGKRRYRKKLVGTVMKILRGTPL